LDHSAIQNSGISSARQRLTRRHDAHATERRRQRTVMPESLRPAGRPVPAGSGPTKAPYITSTPRAPRRSA
jgi:hypothetical protein